jgi:hypothetical protein
MYRPIFLFEEYKIIYISLYREIDLNAKIIFEKHGITIQ